MQEQSSKGRVLIIAGSDPSGGAGIQADIKTVTALGGYAMTAITALTVQDTQAVHDVLPISPDFIRKQIKVALDDIGADAIKIGMIGDKQTAYMISGVLFEEARHIPKVLDPVLVATSGDSLASDGVAQVIYHELMHQPGMIITPNAPELSVLAEMPVTDRASLLKAGEKLSGWCHRPILLKGGHIEGGDVIDVLLNAGSTKTFRNPRIDTRSTHGTGCTLASAIATGLAQGLSVSKAVERSIVYVHKAIETAPGFGKGHGPLNHGHTVLSIPYKDQ